MNNYQWAVLMDLVHLLNAPFTAKKLEACKELKRRGYAEYKAEQGVCGYWHPTKEGVGMVKKKLK